jgi:hypothetical protein
MCSRFSQTRGKVVFYINGVQISFALVSAFRFALPSAILYSSFLLPLFPFPFGQLVTFGWQAVSGHTHAPLTSQALIWFERPGALVF